MGGSPSRPASAVVRRGSAADGPAVARVLNGVVAERAFTAMDRPVTPESETAWLSGFGPRSALFVAEAAGEVVGYQTLEPFCVFLRSMDQVGVAGTQVAKPWRGRGVGTALWRATVRFARENAYEKVLIYVRAGNGPALAFYRGLGFRDVGVARRQVKVDGLYEDEVFLELFLDADHAPPPRAS
jgi:phosphinothricin acetyltransferase